MSNWVKVTNLPYYCDESEIAYTFADIGPIKQIHMEYNQLLLRSAASVKFINSRCARLAATKKDQLVFDDAVIRVRVIWNRKETLTTVEVSNLPLNVTEQELREYFIPYGDVVNITFNKPSENCNNEKTAHISFSRIDYALRACQEMDNSIISGDNDDSGLHVRLINPDSRNLKWKRTLFEYVRCSVPSKRTKSYKSHPQRTTNKNGSGKDDIMDTNGNPDQLHEQSIGVMPKTTRGNSNATMNGTFPWVRSPLLNVSPSLLNTHIDRAGSISLFPSSLCDKNASVAKNTGTLTVPGLGSGAGVAFGSNIQPVSYSDNLNNINTFNNGLINLSNTLSGITSPLNQHGLTANNKEISRLNGTSLYLFPPNVSNYNSLLSNNVKNENIQSNLMFNGSNIRNEGNVRPVSQNLDTYKPFELPNISIASGGNMIFALPQSKCGSTTSILTPSSSSSGSTTPASLYDLSVFPAIKLDSPMMQSTLQPMPISNNKISPIPSVSSSRSSSPSSPSIWSEKQREIGDIIYHELKSKFPARVAKLTGMMLSLPTEELNSLLASNEKLNTTAQQFCQLLDKNECS